METQKGDTTVTMEEAHRILTNMLHNIIGLCEKYGIPYYMYYGSMLGAVRHNGPIPWDPDVDIAVPEDYFEEFCVAMKELDDKYWFDYRNEGNVPRCFPRIGLAGYETLELHVDVYRLVGLNRSHIYNLLLLRIGRVLIQARHAIVVDPNYYNGFRNSLVKVLKVLLYPWKPIQLAEAYDKLCKRYPSFYDSEYIATPHSKYSIIKRALLDHTYFEKYADYRVRVPEGYNEILTSWYGDYISYPPNEEITAALDRKIVLKKL